MFAYRLGRLDAARILIEAGADQRTKDYRRNNLLHAALAFKVGAEQLKPMLDLLDRDALAAMLRERNKLEEGGQTPLHKYISSRVPPTSGDTKEVVRVIKTLMDISPQDARQALRMLSGSGDTPLHLLLLKGADPAIVRTIVDFDPSLLCVENAVGRTPAEVARDCYLTQFMNSCKFETSERQDRSLASLAGVSPSEFVKPKVPDRRREHERTTWVAENWRFCAEVLARNGQPRRTLVGISSVNFVAKRLARKYVNDRYNFRFVEEEEEEGGQAVVSEPSESEDDARDDGSSSGHGAMPGKEQAAGSAGLATKKKEVGCRRGTDEITERYNHEYMAWVRPEEEKAEAKEESDDEEQEDY